ncbi:MAG: hypothetical protein JNK45_22365 [Myxococcales bacterium]|nr:hypothetical protein [Myxococcales bacterium]
MDGRTVPHGEGWVGPSSPGPGIEAPEVGAAAVVVTWNAIQHFYVYFDVVDADWEAELDAAIADVLDDDDAIELELTLSRMLAKLHDAHARVVGPHTTWGSAPIQLARVEGRVVVVAAAPTTGLHRGDEIVAIDGQPVEARLRERSAFVSGSPQWIDVQLLSRARVTRGLAGTSVALEVLRDGRAVRIETERLRDNRIDAFHRPAIERMADGLYYVDLERLEWPELQRALPKLARAREIVFDVRDGVHLDFEHTLSHLVREPVTKPWMFVPRVIHPDRSPAPQWSPMAMTLLPAQPHIGARATFLIDASTVSSDETFTAFVQGVGLGESYGAPTAGTNGDAALIEVPGGFQVYFSGMKARRFDGTQYQVVGLQPTHPVSRTLAGVRAGRDEIRDAALAAARQRLGTK